MRIGRKTIAGLLAGPLLAAAASDALASRASAAPFIVAQSSAAEIEFWRSVADSKNAAELEAYLKAYPIGQFAALAKIRLQQLKGTTQPSTTASDPKAAAPAASQQPAASDRAAADASIPPAPTHKTRGWIGVQVQNIDEKRARALGLVAASGAEIVSLADYGPAAKSNLLPRDVLLSVNGEPATDASHLSRLISPISPGQNAELAIVRAGQRQTVSVVVGDLFEHIWVAAHRGDLAAMRNLGGILAGGLVVEQNREEANKWFHRAADAGDVEAMYTLGWRYQNGLGFDRDEREAARWYRKAADGGNASAMYQLALLYWQGRGVERDLVAAARWLNLAADKGDTAAMVGYGRFLEQGQGVPKNETLAVDYYRRAAKLNQGLAFASLGVAYYTGRGVDKDLRQAAEWFRKAADRGVPRGSLGLAVMYERGEGSLPKDRNEAIKYFRQAAEGGESVALERLRALNATPYDPMEIQQLLSDLGLDPGPVDGRPGTKTAQAIREFQKSRGLNADGQASLALVGQLRNALKQKTAATSSTAPAASSTSSAGSDLTGLQDLEKLD